MKKLILTSILIATMLSISNAQFTKVGGGLALTSGFDFHNMQFDYNRSGVIAASFQGIYEISVPLHIVPSFTVFIPHVTKDQFFKTTVSTLMFDINGHYVFNSLDKFEFYGLAGLDILLAKKKEKYLEVGVPSDPVVERDNALGINLGVGSYMKITEQFDLSAEAKFLFNNKYNQFMLNVGILINIDWLKKHENTGI